MVLSDSVVLSPQTIQNWSLEPVFIERLTLPVERLLYAAE